VMLNFDGFHLSIIIHKRLHEFDLRFLTEIPSDEEH
jgi:hypothetical protein